LVPFNFFFFWDPVLYPAARAKYRGGHVTYVVCLGVYGRGSGSSWLTMGSVRVYCVTVVVVWVPRLFRPVSLHGVQPLVGARNTIF